MNFADKLRNNYNPVEEKTKKTKEEVRHIAANRLVEKAKNDLLEASRRGITKKNTYPISHIK